MTDALPSPHARFAYRPEIDGLRALAVLIVIFYHFDFGFPGGYVGVDIFFVISGYLITSLIRRDLAAGTFSLAGFYERRARRILPASLAMTAVVLLAGYFRLLPADLETLGRSAAAHTLFGANFFFYVETTNYFGGAAANMPLLHTWSLGVEEQFYFAFPLLLIACGWLGRRRQAATAGVVVGLLFAGLPWAIYSVPIYPLAGFFLLPARAWELLAGAALAVLPAWGGPRWVREILATAGITAMLWPAFAYTADTDFPGLAAMPPVFGATLFIAACRGGALPFIGRLFAMRGPAFVGAISYSLYLWHWPILVFAGYWRLDTMPWPTRLAALVAATIVAVLSWRFIETPFRHSRVFSTRWRLVPAVAAGTLAVLAVGVVFDQSAGLPKRFDEKINRIDAVFRERLKLAQLRPGDVIHDRLTPIGVTDSSGPVQLLIWGDSHADALLPAFDEICLARGIRARSATRSSTAPLIDYATPSAKFYRPTTLRFNAEVVNYVRRNKVPAVVLVAYWKRDLAYDAAAVDEAMGRTISALRAAGATTYVLMQVPAYGVPVPKALAGEAMTGREIPGWRQTLATHHQAFAAMYAMAAKYESADCHFIDLADAFDGRGGGPLRVADRGRPLYLDGHHVTNRTAKKLIGPLLERKVFEVRSPLPVLPGEG